MRSQGTAQELERRRILAVTRVSEGKSAVEVADFLDVNERTVRQWYNDFLAGGLAALAPKPPPTRASRLTPQQEAEVLSWLTQNPTDPAFGFPTELWTAARVAGLIKDRFDVNYHPGSVLRWLRQRGVTPQVVRRRPRNHDAAEMQRWAQEEWQRILKKRPSRRHGS
jgi:transposase